MPDYGQLTQDALPHAGPLSAPLYPPPPWPLPRSRLVKVMFETDKEPLLRSLPPKLTRSTPPYGVVTISHHPESPVGAFSLATQHIGCRAGFFIRALTTEAVADTPEAVAGLREIWGFPCRLGRVELEVGATGGFASVSVSGSSLLDVTLSDASDIEPDAIRLDPLLNVRTVPAVEENKVHDLVQLLQIDPDYTIREAVRARCALHYAEQAAGNPWAALPVRNVISAVACSLDTELPLARFVMAYQ
jgi:acetoacetate decarboxylase